ncbi:MAG: antibiotic biosynthesis monooxygenase family protein [Pseudomonadota bacterium]
MILVTTRMKVHSEKRMELSQTITSLSGSIRMEKGCRRCDFFQSIEDENRLFLLEEWDTRENLMAHLNSEHYKVLEGAMILLKKPYERMFHTVFDPAGMEDIYMKSSTKDRTEGKVQEKTVQAKKVLDK